MTEPHSGGFDKFRRFYNTKYTTRFPIASMHGMLQSLGECGAVDPQERVDIASHVFGGRSRR